MKILKLIILIGLGLFAFGGCKVTTSTNSNSANNSISTNTAKSPTPVPTAAAPVKADSAVKDKAQKIVDSGEYRAGERTMDNAKGTAGCTCAAKVAIPFESPDNSVPPFTLCIGKDHPDLPNFSAINSGDLVQFVMSPTAQDGECVDNPATFMKVKTGE